MDQVAKQWQEGLNLGRLDPKPAGADAAMADEESDDTNLDGPDWPMYLTGSKLTPDTTAGQALSDLLVKPPVLTFFFGGGHSRPKD